MNSKVIRLTEVFYESGAGFRGCWNQRRTSIPVYRIVRSYEARHHDSQLAHTMVVTEHGEFLVRETDAEVAKAMMTALKGDE